MKKSSSVRKEKSSLENCIYNVRVKFRGRIRLLIAAGLTVIGGVIYARWPRKPLSANVRADRVLVRKKARTLELYQGTRLLRTYSIALGREPLGHKQQEGDGRTPEGPYVLDCRNPRSAYHRALHISYPSAADTAAALSRGVSPGGLIMLHGVRNGLGFIGRLHRLFDWTDGCIAVTDEEIDEIWRSVPDGTPIEIEP
jgi:murein L,D-transpeptidase YafK